ncbi:SDR family NAD(P)-dependent oxidoreductase [Sphingobacterium sp. LRF_L2]|uniref:SDR family NAD(P)-dependent oxidoreductase n=1 Tax=Sphingobacterium sp. LRF_L2 TaxID=3369421 RepID=UPI003F5EC155
MNLNSPVFFKQVVLVSGALGDIGMAIAQRFVGEGAIVALCDRHPKDIAMDKLSVLDNLGAVYHYDEVDVTDFDQVKTWIDNVYDRFGEFHIVVANAATVTLKGYQELLPEDWSKEIRVNLDGSFFVANYAANCFVKNATKGNIVFMGSWAAHAVHQNLPAYSVSKAAIRMLCQSMALEYATYGIRVNELAPGFVNAGLSKIVWSKNPAEIEQARQQVPLGDIIEADEVADQLLWICNPKNKHLTGSTILIDGGLSLVRK